MSRAADGGPAFPVLERLDSLSHEYRAFFAAVVCCLILFAGFPVVVSATVATLRAGHPSLAVARLFAGCLVMAWACWTVLSLLGLL